MKEYDTENEARSAGRKYIYEWSLEVNKMIDADQKHEGKDPKSPKAGEPYDPIGTMPKKPKG